MVRVLAQGSKGTLTIAEAMLYDAGRAAVALIRSAGRPKYARRASSISTPVAALVRPTARRARHPYDQYVSDPAHPVPYRSRPVEQTYDARGSAGELWETEDQRFVDGRPDVVSWVSDAARRGPADRGQHHAQLVASTTGTRRRLGGETHRRLPRQRRRTLALGGYELMVAHEIMRGRYRKSFSAPEPLAPNTPLEFTVDLHQQSYTFQRGPPDHGAGPEHLVSALRPEPADLGAQHLQGEARRLPGPDASHLAHAQTRFADRADRSTLIAAKEIMPDKPLNHGAAPAAEREVRALYDEVLRCWNERNAGEFARCFSRNGNMVGFDGSPVDGQQNIEEHLSEVFGSHPTAAYIGKVREVRLLSPGVVLLRGGELDPVPDDRPLADQRHGVRVPGAVGLRLADRASGPMLHRASTTARSTLAPARITLSAKTTLSSTSAPASTTTRADHAAQTVPATRSPGLSMLSTRPPSSTRAGTRCGSGSDRPARQPEEADVVGEHVLVRLQVVVRLAQVAPVAPSARAYVAPRSTSRGTRWSPKSPSPVSPSSLFGAELAVQLLQHRHQHHRVVDDDRSRPWCRLRVLGLVGEVGYPVRRPPPRPRGRRPPR